MACLSQENLSIAGFSLLNIILATILPIYNKELYQLLPFPLFVTAIQVTLSVPLALAEGWISLGCPRSLSWAVPPVGVRAKMIFAALSFGLMMGTHNLGIFVSDIDFAVLFKLSGIVWSGIFAKLFLHETMSLMSAVSTGIVMLGTFFIAAKFEFSTDKMPSTAQITIQCVAIIFQSIAGIMQKSVLNRTREEGNNMSVLGVLAWRYAIAIFPIYLISVFTESEAWEVGMAMFNTKSLLMMLGGVIIGELFQLTNIMLTHKLSVIGAAVSGQLKFLPTLVISHLLYRDRTWTWTQIVGAVLLASGTFMFSLSRTYCVVKEEPNEERGEEDYIEIYLPSDEEEEDTKEETGL